MERCLYAARFSSSIEKRPFARPRACRRDFTSCLASAGKKELENVWGGGTGRTLLRALQERVTQSPAFPGEESKGRA